MPDDSNLQSIQITVPTGLISEKTRLSTTYHEKYKALKTKVSSKKNLRKVLRRLQQKNVTVDGQGQVVCNVHVLYGINFDRAVRNAVKGIKKSSYVEFNNLL
jgi:hypothetical protein